MSIYIILLVILFFISKGAFSQDAFWPQILELPQAFEEDTFSQDSLQNIYLTSEFSLLQTLRFRNTLQYEKSTGTKEFFQGADYQYMKLNPTSTLQYVDLSGSIVQKNFLYRGVDIGLEWKPIASYTKRQNGILQSNLDFGPIINHSLFSIPYKIRGGLYGYSRNDSVSTFLNLPKSSYQFSAGVYGGITIGDYYNKIAGIPLFLVIDANIRSIKDNSFGIFSATLLYCKEFSFLGGGDSLFVYTSDSLTNGRELYIGVEEKSFLSNTSWRINHAFSVAGGIKFRERLGIKPKIYGKSYLHSITYPSKSQTLDDVRRSGSSWGIDINTEDNFWIVYKGVLELRREFEDWLFKSKFRNNEIATSQNIDSLIINMSDHYSDIAITKNELLLKFPFNIKLRYLFDAFKDSKQYPFVYLDYSEGMPEEKKNQNESDRVQLNNRIGALYSLDSLFYIETYGSYGILYHYFYRKERSAESKLTEEYRVGFDLKVNTKWVDFSEQVYLAAEISDYYFKKISDKSARFPPYQRDIGSILSCKVKPVPEKIHLNGKWIELYHDNGYWYGKEYWLDSASFEKEFYAIDRKGLQFWLDLSIDFLLKGDTLTIGNIFRDVFQRHYDWAQKTYVLSELDLGYGFEPYFALRWQKINNFLLSLRIKRIFNTLDKDRWKMDKNWDIYIILKKTF
ncbi:MAG: hypothetical protein N2053_04435 [Chitinispirillaceae bacterium]|nr:hypothetical protein [Chitinispirillaceae bacterium]